METRNLFAAAALQGLIARVADRHEFEAAVLENTDGLAKLAFSIADEMMKHTTENRMQRDAIQQAGEMVARINERQAL